MTNPEKIKEQMDTLEKLLVNLKAAYSTQDYKSVDAMSSAIYAVAYSLSCNAFLYRRRTDHG